MSVNLNPEYIRSKPPLPAAYLSMATLAAIAIPMLRQLSWPVMGVFLALCALELWLIRSGRNIDNPYALLSMAFFLAAFVYSQLESVTGRDGGIALLLMLLTLKAFESKTIRDWQVLLLASLFLCVCVLLFDQSMLVAAWAAASMWMVFVCVGTLDGGDVKTSARETALAMAASLPLMLALFVSVPRLAHPLLSMPSQANARSVSGLTDEIEFGSVSSVIQSDKLAFNAYFEDGFRPQRKDLYWRVSTMTRFDGAKWRSDMNFFVVADPQDPSKVDYDKTKTAHPYTLIFDDFEEKGRAPALDHPVFSEPDFWITDSDLTRLRRPYQQLRRAKLASVLEPERPFRGSPASLEAMKALPKGGNPKARAFAADLSKKTGGGAAYADALLRFFSKGGFVYTLNPGDYDSAKDPMDAFLFGRREGFCEHFAASYAFLLRAGGVPARLASGYLGGEHSPRGDYWQVRGRDAHVWVEAYLDGRIRRIDPTGSVSETRLDDGLAAVEGMEGLAFGSSFLPAWALGLKSDAQFFWQKWIVDYDADKQKDLFSKLGFADVGKMGLAFAALFLSALALGVMAALWRAALRRQGSPLQDGFLELKRKAMPGLDEESLLVAGPQDCLLELIRLRQEDPDFDPRYEDLARRFIDLRYKTDHPDPKAVTRWRKAVRRLPPL